MKNNTLVVISMIIIFFISVPIALANSSTIIGNGKAGGYQYTVTKEQNTFSWEIDYHGDLSVIEETKDNREALDHYMNAVSDIKVEIIEIIISVSYFLIVSLVSLILFKKNKQMLKGDSAIIALCAGIALYNTLITSIDLTSSIDDAKFYYLILVTN